MCCAASYGEIDLGALGRPLQAMIAHPADRPRARADRGLHGPPCARCRAYLSVFHMTGVTDYLVWVAAADMHELREFVVDKLVTHPAVAHAETSLIYEHRRGPGIVGGSRPGPLRARDGERGRSVNCTRSFAAGAGRAVRGADACRQGDAAARAGRRTRGGCRPLDAGSPEDGGRAARGPPRPATTEPAVHSY